MSQQQQPSPGRVVLTNIDGTERPAIVTHVHFNGKLDLHVLKPTHQGVLDGNGRMDPDGLPSEGTWWWPPRA